MHEEALTDQGRQLFPALGNFAEFYLVGGTGLALQIGHRKSVDFDFFTSERLSSGLLPKTKRTFPDSAVVVTYNTAEQLNILVDGIKMTFLQYQYPVLDPFVTIGTVSVASIQEIAAMKAFSIGKRLSYRDYVDWYFLLSQPYVSLPEVIEFAQKKFGNDFNDRLFLSQLVSFDDIEELPIDFLKQKIERETIEHTLQEAVKKVI